MNQTANKDPLGSAWIIIATLGFTVMNLCIKAAAGNSASAAANWFSGA